MLDPIGRLKAWFKYNHLMCQYVRASQQGNFSVAIDAVKKQLELNILPSVDRGNLARLYERSGDIQSAEYYYRQADDKQDLGVLLAKQGRHDEAVPLVREELSRQMSRMLENDKHAWFMKLTVRAADFFFQIIAILKGKKLKETLVQAEDRHVQRQTDWQRWAYFYLQQHEK
jgi:hypothetical protein